MLHDSVCLFVTHCRRVLLRSIQMVVCVCAHSLDCVGILKLRNADVEKRLGPVKAKARKRNSTKARLVCRCCLAKPDGSRVILQTASTSILCSEPQRPFLSTHPPTHTTTPTHDHTHPHTRPHAPTHTTTCTHRYP